MNLTRLHRRDHLRKDSWQTLPRSEKPRLIRTQKKIQIIAYLRIHQKLMIPKINLEIKKLRIRRRFPVICKF